MKKWFVPVMLVLVLLAAGIFSACRRQTSTNNLEIEILQPSSGQVILLNHEIIIRSQIPFGIKWSRLELLVNRQPIRLDLAENYSSSTVVFDQPWIPTQLGPAMISVQLFDESGKTFVSDEVAILVYAETDNGMTATPSPMPTRTATPTVTITPTPKECSLSYQLLEDVTIPPGTVLLPGQYFIRTWRLQNNGSCDWKDFQLVYVRGSRMAGTSPTPLPEITAGETFNLALNLLAPSYQGFYDGIWQIQTDKGVLFGPELIVRVGVVAATATAVPPVIPTDTKPATATITSTPNPSATATRQPTQTKLPTKTRTNTPQPTVTDLPQPTPTNPPANTRTPTPQPTPTNPPAHTRTPTPQPTPTDFFDPTPTDLPADTRTPTPQSTPTDFFDPTPTDLPANTRTPTPQPTPTIPPQPKSGVSTVGV